MIKITTLQTYFSLKFYKNWSVHEAKKKNVWSFKFLNLKSS